MGLVVPFVVIVAAWAFLFTLTFPGWILAVLDRRSARDQEPAGRHLRDRIRELVWTLSFAPAVLVFGGFLVDYAGRLTFDDAAWQWGLGLLIAVAIAFMLFGLLVVWMIIRLERPTYATIRSDIRELAASRPDRQAVDQLHDRLKQADGRQGGPSLWGVNVLAIATMVVSAGVAVFTVVIIAAFGGWTVWWFWLFFVIPPGAGITVAVMSRRAAYAAREAWRGVYAMQRAEVVVELDRLERRVGKNPGLADRVSRALAILREQQGGGRS